MPSPKQNGADGWIARVEQRFEHIMTTLHWHGKQIDLLSKQTPAQNAGALSQWKDLLVALASAAPALRWLLGIAIVAAVAARRIDLGSISLAKLIGS